MRPNTILPLLSLSILAACGGGGGGATPPTPLPIASPTPHAAASKPPSSTNVVNTAPLASAPTTQSARRAQSTLGGSANLLIESTGTAAQWAGNIVAWFTNPQGVDVSETTAIATTTNGLQIDNPPLTKLSCGQPATSPSTWCAAHPLGWYFGTDSGLVKPVGQQTITLTFGDGTTGTITDDVYNGFSLSCGQSIEYESNIPTVVTSNADVTYDCAAQTLDFPHGVMTAAQPAVDQFGRSNTVISTVLNAVAVGSGAPMRIPFANVQQNAVYVFKTTDGGFAKILSSGVGGTFFQGLSLHAQVDGSYAY